MPSRTCPIICSFMPISANNPEFIEKIRFCDYLCGRLETHYILLIYLFNYSCLIYLLPKAFLKAIRTR